MLKSFPILYKHMYTNTYFLQIFRISSLFNTEINFTVLRHWAIQEERHPQRTKVYVLPSCGSASASSVFPLSLFQKFWIPCDYYPRRPFYRRSLPSPSLLNFPSFCYKVFSNRCGNWRYPLTKAEKTIKDCSFKFYLVMLPHDRWRLIRKNEVKS